RTGGPISESAAPVDRESCSYAGPYRISYPLSVTLPPPGDTIPKGALSQASGLSTFLGWFSRLALHADLPLLINPFRRSHIFAVVGGMMVVSGDVAINARASGSSGATRAYPPWAKRPTLSVPDRVRVCGGSKTSLRPDAEPPPRWPSHGPCAGRCAHRGDSRGSAARARARCRSRSRLRRTPI